MNVRELRVTYGPSLATLREHRQLLCPRDAVRLVLLPILDPEPVEVIGVLLLNTKHQALGWHEVGRGTLDQCSTGPREILRAAILANAAGLILAHNHPSGDPTPSLDDDALTTRIAAAGQLMGVDLLDHIIVGNGSDKYYSYKEAGKL